MVKPHRDAPVDICQRTGAAGFTLLELLLALVVSIGVVGAATLLASQMQGAYRAQLEGATAQQEGRFAIQRVEQYLRAAGNNPYRVVASLCPPGGTAFLGFFDLDPNGDGVFNDVRVQMDANPVDGLIGGGASGCNEPGEDVSIALEPIQRTITVRDNNVGGQAQHITDTVIEDLRFVYRTPTRAVTTSPANIAFVETIVTVRSRIRDLSTGLTPTYVVRSEIRVRNR